jgi:hypothetical protein
MKTTAPGIQKVSCLATVINEYHGYDGGFSSDLVPPPLRNKANVALQDRRGCKRYAAAAVQVITHTQGITGCSSAVIFKLDCINTDLMLPVAALGECDQGRQLWREEGACMCTVLLPVNLQSKGECDGFGCGKEIFEL